MTLSSHDFKSEIKDAMWEFNHILKSIHLLKYVDDPVYRQYIRTALNRGEAYHQILERIMTVGGSGFRGMSELEVEIWNECARLIALIIIYYNMHLLSKLYENAVLRSDMAAIEFLRHISPVASQHINLSGLYEFSEIIENINVDGIVEALNRILKRRSSRPQCNHMSLINNPNISCEYEIILSRLLCKHLSTSPL